MWMMKVVLVIFCLIQLATSFGTILRPKTHGSAASSSPQEVSGLHRLQPLSAELRILIHGTKNAYTTVRSGDVLSYKHSEAVEGQTLRLGTLSSDGKVLPLCNRVKHGAEFYIDHTATPLSADQLKQENRLYRIVSSDRKGNAFLIEEYLDDNIYIPVIAEGAVVHPSASTLSEDGDNTDLLQRELQLLQLQTTLLQQKIKSSQQKKSLHAIVSNQAPKPVGPYSQGVKANGMLFASGCIGLDPSTSKLVSGGIEAEAIQSMKNLRSILQEGGADFQRIIKTTIFVTDLKQYGLVNQIYADFLKANPIMPARTTVEVSALPLGALVEIEAIALLEE